MKTQLPRQLDAEKKLYKRLFSAYFDLEVAQATAHQILSRKLHSATDADDRILLWCLNISLTVSYCRPFSSSRSEERLPQTIPERILRVFNASEMGVHRRIKEIRDKDHAHSDLAMGSIRVVVAPGPAAVPRWRNPFAPLSQEVVTQLETMISKLIAEISAEQARIQSSLRPGDAF